MASLYVRDHQGKSKYLTARLLEYGHTRASIDACDVFLVDNEWSPWCIADIARAKEHGALVVNYGHGFPMLAPPREAHPLVDAHFCTTNESAALCAEWDRPGLVCGWQFSERRPPRYMEGRTLFAPIHTDGGDLATEYEQVNATVRALLPPGVVESVGAGGAARTIREAIDLVDAAHLVVGSGTFAYLAVARGCPTVMFCDDGLNHPTYPFTLPCELKDAMRFTPELEAWKAATIGGDFDPACLDVLL